VPDADRAEHLAVVAKTESGLGVFFLEPDAADISRTPAFDRSLHLADVVLEGVTVPDASAAVGPDTAQKIDRARQWAVTGIATATVGASQRAFDIALEHIKQRHQFNVPIGSFQALKHMAVDVLVAIERARALTQFAALAIADNDPRRALAASMAKAAAGDCQRIAVRHSIQFFGGLGYTWENDVQLFARRAKAGELLFGSGPQHRAEVARIALATGPAWEVAR
jgi:alkylation response protein AidB-like acyl-CoA dehydrogenase